MDLLLGLALWIASLGFPDRVQCYVRGYVSTEGGQVTIKREDHCDVHVVLTGLQMLVIHEPYWVLIEFPEAPGFESFWYQWGAARAYLHGRPIPVVWGYTATG